MNNPFAPLPAREKERRDKRENRLYEQVKPRPDPIKEAEEMHKERGDETIPPETYD